MFRLNSLLIFTCLFVLSACKPKSKKLPEDFDYGSIENHVYHNKYFGMDMKLPAHWSVTDKDGMKKYVEKAKEISGEKLAKQIEKAEDVGSAILLSVRKYHLDSLFDGVGNASLAIVAENTIRKGNISATQFLDRLKLQMKNNGMDVVYSDNYSTTMMGGKEFKVMPVNLHKEGDPIQQEYYVTRIKIFILTFILTFRDKEEKNELKEILATLTFQ